MKKSKSSPSTGDSTIAAVHRATAHGQHLLAIARLLSCCHPEEFDPDALPGLGQLLLTETEALLQILEKIESEKV